MGKILDLTGHRFSRLTVTSMARIAAFPSGKRYAVWNAECKCGKRITVSSRSLRQQHTRSCGCLSSDVTRTRSTKHGHTPRVARTRIYRCWANMIARCCIPSASNYPYYGARGISVCARWRASFESFLADVGTPPEGTSLDRIDNGGDYEPGNVRWASKREQARNTRRNHFIEYNGRRATLAEFAVEFGLCPIVLNKRLRRGWPVDVALTTPSLRRPHC